MMQPSTVCLPPGGIYTELGEGHFSLREFDRTQLVVRDNNTGLMASEKYRTAINMWMYTNFYDTPRRTILFEGHTSDNIGTPPCFPQLFRDVVAGIQHGPSDRTWWPSYCGVPYKCVLSLEIAPRRVGNIRCFINTRTQTCKITVQTTLYICEGIPSQRLVTYLLRAIHYTIGIQRPQIGSPTDLLNDIYHI
jgi:hypothetical protein